MAHGDRKIQNKRGTRNCGWGNTQKHRGAGSRGGRGMAGSNKHKWTYISKFCPGYFGRRGFKIPEKMQHDDVTINVGNIDRIVEKMVADGKAQAKGGKYQIDLTALGFDKLLGGGKVSRALEIKVGKSSPSAIEKVKGAGGKVDLPAEAA
jgi:large subunit ribosomal protein L15